MQTYKKQEALLWGLRAGEKFLFSIVVIFIMALLFQFLGMALAAWIYGFPVSELMSMSSSMTPELVAANKLVQIIGSIGTFIIPAFFLSYLFTGDFFSLYSFREPLRGLPVLLVLAMTVSVIPLINYMAELNLRLHLPFESVDTFLRDLELAAEKVMKAFTSNRTPGALAVNLFMIGVLAAVGEELIFRGLIQSLLIKITRNVHLAVFLTAFVFSAFHFQFFSFLPRFFLGLLLGYLLVWGKSIWYPILAHFVNNAMGVVYYYFNSMGSVDDKLEEIGTSSMMPIAAVLSLLLFVLFFAAWFRQVQKINQYPRSAATGTN